MRIGTWLRRLAPFAGVVALALVLYAPVVFLGRVFYWGDVLLAFHPWRKYASASILRGVVPLWNPYTFLGTPFAANAQSAVFYPPGWLLLGLSPERALALSVVGHVALAGVGTVAYLRVLGLGRTAACLGGATFMLGAPLVTKAQLPPVVATSAWLPVILALIERGARTGGRRWALAAGVAAGLQALAGHPQMALLSALAVGPYVVWRVFRKPWPEEQRPSRLLLLLVPPAVGLGLAAVQLLPTLELSRYYVRAGGLSAEAAARLSLNPAQALALVAPSLFGHPASGTYWGSGNYWEMAGYVGVLPLALAAVGFLSRRGPATFFGLLGLAALGLSFGSNAALYGLLYRWLPAFEHFRAPARCLFLSGFAAAVLAAIGYDALFGSERSPRRPGWLGLFLAALLFHLFYAGFFVEDIVSATARWLGSETGPEPELRAWIATGAYYRFLLLAALSTLFVYLGYTNRIWGWAAASAALVLACVDLLTFAIPATPHASRTVYRRSPPAMLALSAHAPGWSRVFVTEQASTRTWNRFVSPADYGPNTPWHVLAFRNGLAPNLLMGCGFREVRGYDPAAVRGSLQLGQAIDRGLRSRSPARREAALRLLARLGTTVVADGPAPREAELGRPFHSSHETHLYAVPHARPRVWVVTHRTPVPSYGPAAARLLHPEFDPGRSVLLVERGLPDPPHAPDPADRARIASETTHRLLIRARAARPGWLIVGDTCYPGWQALVDGSPAPVLRADYALRAVPVPAGCHTVLLRYRPTSYRLGLYISLLTGLVLAALAGLSIVPRLVRART